jgi:hypothetical protein
MISLKEWQRNDLFNVLMDTLDKGVIESENQIKS